MYTVTYRDRHATTTETCTDLADALRVARRLSAVVGVLSIGITTPSGAAYTAW